jgi:6-phosphogluconolactonase (cycloisomerase 2 family)
MPSRRTFLSFLAGGAVAPQLAAAQERRGRLALYTNVGPVLTHYDVDLATAALVKRDSVTLPAGVQYCWPHRNRRHFYVASSSGAPGSVPVGAAHHVTAFEVDSATGALRQIGDPMRLPVRPIHLTLDNESQHILVAFNNPSSLRVYRIHKDFTPGEEVRQDTMDAGIYAHQVRVTPDGRHVVLVTRGNEGTPQRPEDPGALMVFEYRNGRLSHQYKIAPGGGRGYGPRHLDFHPTRPWMYVSVETQNQIHMHRLQDGTPLPDVLFNKTTLLEPTNIRSRQAASAVHVHPNGRFVYVANRSQELVDFNGRKVFKGGEQHRRLRHQPGDRRTDRNPAHRNAEDPSAHVPHGSRWSAAGGRAQPAGRFARWRRCSHRGGGAVGLPHERGRQAHRCTHLRRRRR